MKNLTFSQFTAFGRNGQQHWEALNELYLKWVKYEKDLEIMGKPGIVTQKQIKM